MSNENYELDYPIGAAQSAASERADFIRRVYAHLAGAVLALIAIEAVLLTVVPPDAVFRTMFSSQWSWLVIMVMFMGASFLARSWAQSQTSVAMQYMGLGLYVVAEAIIFLPILIVAQRYQQAVNPETNIIAQAGILTLAVFGGLSLAVFTTRKDFSFLGPIVSVGFWIALGVIVAGILFGFNLGLFFSFAMIALMSACILYQTSNIMLYYPTHMHVAAALELFASVATLFWYILRILMSISGRD